MKHVVISDIHGNLEAFNAVTMDLPDDEYQEIYSAGDIVGYGADPAACLRGLADMNAKCVIGNHDAAVSGLSDLVDLNEPAAKAVMWTREALSAQDKAKLSTLPYIVESDLFAVAHGTLHGPEKFNYMLGISDAWGTFRVLKKWICFVGHTHVPGVFILSGDKVTYSTAKDMRLDKDARYIINAGSVGQPRDNDTRACYCVFDDERGKIMFRKVSYDIKTAQDKIRSMGLSDSLAERLGHGW
ncbi:MAG: metallophosphoesterase family protein [Candidatus Omnitrophica bacterium]|nr:metallophosphoesterase family protein [Candidatus Omnitrophota bacterium]